MQEPTTFGPTGPAYLRALLEQSPDCVLVHDREGRFVDANQRACDFLGYSRKELLSLSVIDMETEHHLLLGDFRARLEDGERLVLRGRHRRADGSTVSVDIQLRELPGSDGELVCAFIREAASELTISQPIEHSQQLEFNVYREIFESASDAIAIIDHEGRYLVQNRAHEALLGFENRDLIHKTPAIHLGPQAFQEVAAELATSGSYVGVLTSRKKSGEEVRLELSAFSVSQGPDKPPLFVGIKRDLSKRDQQQRAATDRKTKELEESLRQAQKMELIGRLAAGVAHDFNNLLTPILGYADLELTERGARDAAADATTDSLRQIREAAQRGKELTQQLLTFGRKQVLQKSVLDLRTVVEKVEKLLRRLISTRVAIKVSVADDVDPVLGDPLAIEQILMNLTTNAYDAMPDGGEMSIEVGNLVVSSKDELARVLGEGGSFVQLSVRDTGHGMSEATKAQIFDPFYTEKPRGTGLGLSIVHGIVGQHDGYIHVESAVGVGSTFRVVLPRTVRATEATKAVSRSAARADGETILVAEDEPQVRQLVRHVLESYGYRVLSAEDGFDALAVAAQHEGRIDLLLTDVVMPGISGRDLYEKIRTARPGVRVLFMTGYAGDELPAASETGSLSVVHKPFSATELTDRVAEVLT
ncbi:MAG: PAS domain S-box protein [Planctomycetota bacterium]